MESFILCLLVGYYLKQHTIVKYERGFEPVGPLVVSPFVDHDGAHRTTDSPVQCSLIPEGRWTAETLDGIHVVSCRYDLIIRRTNKIVCER